MPSNTEFKRKIIVISIIFGFVSLVLICFIIYPFLQKIKKNSQDFVGERKEIILFQTKVGEVERARESYKKLKSDLDKIDKIFIDPEVPIGLIEFWEKTAADSGLSVDISPVSLKTVKNDTWNSIGFRLNLVGSFPNFLKFLEKIETNPYLSEVQDIIVKKLSEGVGDVSVSLTVKVFTK